MARRLIGLDIGTNAVTVAEVRAGDPPRLDMFGQVALGRETMREGEVAHDAAVTEAVGRLRDEVGLKKAARAPRAREPARRRSPDRDAAHVARGLSSALQFQAAELIPIPLDDAVLDFAILGPASPGEGGEPRMRVLLAAVQEATVLRLVAAVEAGGLQVAAVDLVPLALIRSLATPARELALVGGAAVGAGHLDRNGRPHLRIRRRIALAESPGAEGIVSFGGGVTAIAVHEVGVPRFVRVLGTGGRELTDAIATELDLPPETAEALKRQLGGDAHEPRHDELVARARTSIERPLSVLLDEVRSSIDYYRNQPGSSPLLRIVATGGAAQLPGLTERLSALIGVPVEHARPRELVALGDIGFADDELPRLDPYLPAAVGLALGGAGVGTVIDLLPRTRRNAVTRRRKQLSPKTIAVGTAFAVVLGGVTFLTNQSVSHAKSQRAAVTAQVTHVSSQLSALQPILDRQQQITALEGQPALAARDRCVVADDDEPHHREPPRRRDAHVVAGSGDTSRSRRGRRAAGDHTGRVGRFELRNHAEHHRSAAAAAADDLGHDHVPRHREGLSDARELDRRDGQGAADHRRLRDQRAGGSRRCRRRRRHHVLRDRRGDARGAERSAEPVREGGEMKTKNMMVGILAAVLVVALWWTMLLKPTRAKAAKVRADTEIEQSKLEPLQAQLAQAQRDAAHAATFKAQLESLQQAMPDSPALAAFIRNANDISEASGVAWQSVTHGPPTLGADGVNSITLGIQVGERTRR